MVFIRRLTGKEKGGSIPFMGNGVGDLLFGLIPKANNDVEGKLLRKEALWEIPADQESLPFKGAFLTRIGCAHPRAGEELLVDPLFLHVEMVLVATGEKEEENEKRSHRCFLSGGCRLSRP